MKKSVSELRKMTVEERQKYLKKCRDRDREKVKGVFRFYEVPNGNLTFYYKIYKEDPVEKYSMDDGKVYTIPLGVARHLNTSGWYPVHAYKLDEQNMPHQSVGKKVRRYGFQSLDFMDMDDMQEIGEALIETPNSIK